MTRVTFVTAGGDETTVDAQDGYNLMQVALGNDIDGVVGECGGSMMCSTCHVFIDPAFSQKTGHRNPGEDEVLEGAASERRETSRLACQIIVRPELAGLVVRLPERQV